MAARLRSDEIVVMGVAGSGKSTVGTALSQRLGFEFIEGDELHSTHDIAKMSAGHPLTDADRLPWLELVGAAIARGAASGGVVATCSALKRTYRDVLRRHAPAAFFVWLDGSFETIEARVRDRPASLLPPALLPSQFEALEPLQPDEQGVRIDVTWTPTAIVDRVVSCLTIGG